MNEAMWNEGKALIRKLRNRTITVNEMRRLTEIRVTLRKEWKRGKAI